MSFLQTNHGLGLPTCHTASGSSPSSSSGSKPHSSCHARRPNVSVDEHGLRRVFRTRLPRTVEGRFCRGGRPKERVALCGGWSVRESGLFQTPPVPVSGPRVCSTLSGGSPCVSETVTGPSSVRHPSLHDFTVSPTVLYATTTLPRRKRRRTYSGLSSRPV